MFAEADWAAPAGYAAWIACAAFSLWLLNQGHKAVEWMRGANPQPPNNELGRSVQALSTKHEALHFRVTNLEASHNDLSAELKAQTKTLSESADARARRIYDHVNGVRRELDEKLDDVRADINQTPSRVIAELRATKGLIS